MEQTSWHQQYHFQRRKVVSPEKETSSKGDWSILGNGFEVVLWGTEQIEGLCNFPFWASKDAQLVSSVINGVNSHCSQQETFNTSSVIWTDKCLSYFSKECGDTHVDSHSYTRTHKRVHNDMHMLTHTHHELFRLWVPNSTHRFNWLVSEMKTVLIYLGLKIPSQWVNPTLQREIVKFCRGQGR